MVDTNCNINRLRLSHDEYHQELRDSAAKFAGCFVRNASYGCLRNVFTLRQMVDESGNRISLAFLTENEEIRDHFKEVIAEHPELNETDSDGCVGEDGSIFVVAWLDEVCSRWSDIQDKL